MNDDVVMERVLRGELARIADGVWPPDELLDQIVATTSGQRPRSRVLALLAQPEMRSASRVLVGVPHRGLVIIAVLALLTGLAAALVGAIVLRPLPEPGVSVDWPMFRGDASRTGHAAAGPVGRGVVAWRFSAGAPVTQNLSIVGDTVFAPSDDGAVHALALNDGAVRWTAAIAEGPLGGLAFEGDTLYVPDGDGYIHALDPASGRERWRTADPVEGPTALTAAEGRVYVGTVVGTLVAFDAPTGDRVWTSEVSETGSAINAPSYADGRLYVSTSRAGIAAVEASNGRVVWRFDTGSDEMSSTVLADGLAYVGTLSEGHGRLRAIDVATGTIRWQRDERFEAPAVADGVAYGVAEGALAALDAGTGAERWRVRLAGSAAPLAIAGDVIYLATNADRRVHAYDRSSGGKLWSVDMDGRNRCCVAVARGHVFFATDSGSVYAVRGDGASIVPAAPVAVAASTPSPAGPGPSTPPAASPVDPGPIRHIWTATFPEEPESLPTYISVAPDGRVWACDPVKDRFAIFTPDGDFLEHWGSTGTRPGEFVLTRPNGDAYGAMAFASDGSFFVLDVGNFRVQAFGPDRQYLTSWGRHGTDPGEFSGPAGISVGPDGLVYVLDEIRGVVEVFEPDGTVVRTIDAYPRATPGFNSSAGLAIGPDGHLFVGYYTPKKVSELDASGAFIRDFGASGPGAISAVSGYPVIGPGRRLYFAQDPGRGNGPPILVYEPDATFLTGIVGNGTGDGEVVWPTGMAFDAAGDLYVSDVGGVLTGSPHGRIQKFELEQPLSP